MDFSEIMDIVKTFLNAIVTILQKLGLDKLFQKKDEGETTTGA